MSAIAAQLGLSRMSVSCVVNGHARRIGLSEKTIQRVREHLDRCGYVPSRAACHLRASPKNVVGLLHVDSLYSHLAEAFRQFARKLAGSDPALEIMVTQWQRLNPSIQELVSRRVTDLVWVHNSSAGEEYRNPDIAGYLASMRTVIYNFPFDSPQGSDDLIARGISLVGVDRTAHFQRLGRFLHRLGHRVVALPDAGRPNNERNHQAFESAGLTVADCPPPFTVNKMRKAMKEQGVTAAAFHGDSPACMAICSLRAAGIRVPEDLTVTGFDGMARLYNQDLTTLAFPIEKMVGTVCSFARGEGVEGRRYCFDMELVKARTHGPPVRTN